MYNKVKLTKRQIKEDKFTTFMLSTREQIQENWQFWVIGLLALILVVAAGSYYFSTQSSKSVEAAQRYAEAMTSYRNGQSQVAIIAFAQVVEEFGSEKPAEQATFMLGKANYEARNYPEAIRYFEMYLSKYKDNKLDRAASLAGIASAQENQGEYAIAAEGFVSAYQEYPDGPLAAEYLASAVRDFSEAGQVDQARQYLEIVQKDFPTEEASRRAARIFAEKNPG